MTDTTLKEQFVDETKDFLTQTIKEELEDGKDYLVSQLEKPEYFNALVKNLNDSVDVPLISENTEEKIIRGILKCVISSLKEMDLSK